MNMTDNHTKAIVGATAAAVGALTAAVGALTAAGLAYFYSKKLNEPLPTKWKKVGKVVDLNWFPLKSCAPVKRDSFECHLLGFEYENLFDRCFVITRNNVQINNNMYPNVLLIEPKVAGDGKLILCAPGKSDFTLDLEELRARSADGKVKLLVSTVSGIDAGDDVADWLSEFLASEPGVVRLLFYPVLYPTQEKPKKFDRYKAYKKDDVGAFHNTNSYMLLNQASVDSLNTLLDYVVKPLQFRPNIVISGPDAYAEDKFEWIRIGEDAIFRNVKPCNRCPQITVNPDTAERHPTSEPLKTLLRYRRILPTEGPVMGCLLAIRQRGKVSIGDSIYVNFESDD